VRAGGLGLVAACDIAVAPFDATFAFTEVRLGLVPAIVAVFCQPLMQPRAFAHYTLTGVPFDAAEAAQHGLVTLAVDRTRLETTIAEIVDQLLLAAPAALARTKGLLGELPTFDLDEGLALTSSITATQFQSDDAVEGIAAFRDKRLPAWARPRG
jgi:enoyl-CoA hydratase/carnithine racemase